MTQVDTAAVTLYRWRSQPTHPSCRSTIQIDMTDSRIRRCAFLRRFIPQLILQSHGHRTAIANKQHRQLHMAVVPGNAGARSRPGSATARATTRSAAARPDPATPPQPPLRDTETVEVGHYIGIALALLWLRAGWQPQPQNAEFSRVRFLV